MAAMNLLQICNAALGELGLPQQSTIIGSQDPTAVQMLALANREGNELWRARDWTFLQTEFIINLATSITKTGDVVANSAVVSNIVGGTSDLIAGAMAVSGTGMPSAQRLPIGGVDSSTQVTLEMESTETAVGASITFVRDTYALPVTFDHYITNTWWDRTNHWMLVGPQSPQFDQWQRSGIVTTGPRLRWRQIGTRPTVWRVWPPPTDQTVPDALVFEYISNAWIVTISGTYISSFAADTDVPLFNEQMMILGLKWRFFQIKGFDYGAMQAEYVDFVSREKARDGGMPDLSTTRRRFPWLITSANVQDGNFPG